MFLQNLIYACVLKYPSLILHLLRLYMLPHHHKTHQILRRRKRWLLKRHHAFMRILLKRMHYRPEVLLILLHLHQILLFFNCDLLEFFFLKGVFFLGGKGGEVVLELTFDFGLGIVLGLAVFLLFDLLGEGIGFLAVEFAKIEREVLELVDEAENDVDLLFDLFINFIFHIVLYRFEGSKFKN